MFCWIQKRRCTHPRQAGQRPGCVDRSCFQPCRTWRVGYTTGLTGRNEVSRADRSLTGRMAAMSPVDQFILHSNGPRQPEAHVRLCKRAWSFAQSRARSFYQHRQG